MDILHRRPHLRRMDFASPLVPATLIRRYKRFLADCRLDDGSEITAHCANPGSMMGLANPGMRIWLEPNDDPKKKLRYGWRLVEHHDGHFTGVDTSVPNRMLKAALEAREVPALDAYTDVRAEVKYGEKSRIDFLLSAENLPDAYVEVKSVTLCRRPGIAEFPDAKTERGARHMLELALMAKQGHRAAVFFLVQRTDASEVRIAEDIDPRYAQAFLTAYGAGVEVIAHSTNISPKGVTLGPQLPVALPVA
ncbi:sugar fermentation stimulation protein [Sinisalibacter aestuarii]|uniref:Sugar fermentation stimulation protein homolog n=2 Tax=Sinisalibacter aestuarii TaxID=2949426 RepID=A0ABQ5LUZ4_9RHOB|nr:sugar fermentation stimulation protein [Sinisalibacter aestuarii]